MMNVEFVCMSRDASNYDAVGYDFSTDVNSESPKPFVIPPLRCGYEWRHPHCSRPVKTFDDVLHLARVHHRTTEQCRMTLYMEKKKTSQPQAAPPSSTLWKSLQRFVFWTLVYSALLGLFIDKDVMYRRNACMGFCFLYAVVWSISAITPFVKRKIREAELKTSLVAMRLKVSDTRIRNLCEKYNYEDTAAIVEAMLEEHHKAVGK